MKIKFLFFVLLAFTPFAYSQTPYKVQDTTAALKLNDLCRKAINTGKFDSAFHYVSKALKISSGLNFKKGIAGSYFQLGKIHQRQHDADKAFKYFEMALNLYERLGDLKGIGASNNSIALTYFGIGNYPRALEHYYEALKVAERMQDSNLLSVTYNNIGTIREEQKNYPKALEFYTKSFNLIKSIKDSSRLGSIVGNLGIIYDRQLNYKKALAFYNEALVIAQRTGNKGLEAKMYANIGSVEFRTNPDAALENQFKALQIRQAMGNEVDVAKILYNMSAIYLKMNNNAMALKYALEANSLARKINLLKTVEETEWTLKDIYGKEKNFDKAYEHFNKYVAAHDSINNTENTENMLRTEMNYEFDKKIFAAKQEQLKREAEADARDKRQQIIIWTIVFFVGLLVVIAFLVIRQFRYRNKEREMQLEQKLLRSQMNPHFIFNSLQAIQNFILQRNEKDAVRYLGSFASITRSVLENSRLELIPVRKELSLLENYLQLQKLRFGDKFNYHIRVDENMDTNEIFIPPMLSQPFIENALEHGMSNISEGGLIEIRFFIKQETLIMEITDNGNGIADLKDMHASHTSLATTITRERIELMNKKSKFKTLFDIAEAYPGQVRKGVKVCFSIPLNAI